MNKIVAFFELPGMTPAQYDSILAELKHQGKLAGKERLSHVAFQKNENWCVVDVWESAEALQQFGENTLFPIFGKLGITPSPPQVFPLYHFIGTAEGEFLIG